MTAIGLPDPTGTNPLYLQANIPWFVYENGMKILFENSAIYADSLIIALTDGTGRQLARNTDWEVRSDDIDQAAMARAKLEDRSFAKTLVKSVTIISNLSLNQVVAMTFQQYWDTVPGRSYDDGTPFEVTPDLIKDHDRSIAAIRQQIARVTSPVVPNLTVPKLLPFDINGQRPGNKIVDEIVSVNTVAGGKVIRVSQGAFFKDSLVLKYNGNTLSPTTDYTAVMPSSLLKFTTNVSGIFNYILLSGSFAGDISVSYHAVGGDVQISDIEAIYQQSIAVQTFLNEGIFVTADSLSGTVPFQAMHARILSLEEDMRRLLTGTPTYGDQSAGAAVTRPVSTPDADLHWFSIAKLYQVQGSTDIIRSDQFKGRVYLPGSKISVAFTLDFNMDQPRNAASFTTDSIVFDPTYELFGDLDVAAPQYPLVRVVWNEAAEAFSGAIIQIGVPLPTLADMMVVENFSSAESCWILDRSNEFVTGQTVNPSIPQDSGFLLPDDVSLWADGGNVSKQRQFVPEYKKGYLVYSGSQNTLQSLTTVASTTALFNLSIPEYFPIDTIRELVITLVTNDSQSVYDLVVPMTGVVEDTRMGKVSFADSYGEAMSLDAVLAKDDLGVLTLGVNVTQLSIPLVSGDASPKTDLVRYIRARV